MPSTKLTRLPLLRSESAEEYESLHARLQKELKPKGVIEEIYLEEIAMLLWEIMRLRKFKIAIINKALPRAIVSVLEQLLFKPYIMERVDAELEAARLAEGWLQGEPSDKKQVRQILEKFGLDETAFEAEAMRLCVEQFEYLDRALAMAGSRFDRALHMIVDYPANLAIRLRRQSDQILKDDPAAAPICIEHDADGDHKTAA